MKVKDKKAEAEEVAAYIRELGDSLIEMHREGPDSKSLRAGLILRRAGLVKMHSSDDKSSPYRVTFFER